MGFLSTYPASKSYEAAFVSGSDNVARIWMCCFPEFKSKEHVDHRSDCHDTEHSGPNPALQDGRSERVKMLWAGGRWLR